MNSCFPVEVSDLTWPEHIRLKNYERPSREKPFIRMSAIPRSPPKMQQVSLEERKDRHLSSLPAILYKT